MPTVDEIISSHKRERYFDEHTHIPAKRLTHDEVGVLVAEIERLQADLDFALRNLQILGKTFGSRACVAAITSATRAQEKADGS